jgi:hypothetical protein
VEDWWVYLGWIFGGTAQWGRSAFMAETVEGRYILIEWEVDATGGTYRISWTRWESDLRTRCWRCPSSRFVWQKLYGSISIRRIQMKLFARSKNSSVGPIIRKSSRGQCHLA